MKRKLSFLMMGVIIALCCSIPLKAQNSAQNVAYGDSWVATDALGRTLPTYAQCGPVQANRYVGLFFWLNQGQYRTNPIYDVTNTLQANPTNPVWQYADYFWGQPEFNYYNSQDTWVMTKQIMEMSAAGVDFVYFDYTNGFSYYSGFYTALMNFCNISETLRSQGIQTPRIVFFFNVDGQELVQQVYNDIYSQNKFTDLWFIWQGKPLIMINNPSQVTSSTLQNFFNLKNTWAFNGTGQNQWNFLSNYPQDYSWATDANHPEEMAISKSMGAPLVQNGSIDNKGSSFHANTVPTYNQYWVCPQTGQGAFFDEQWSRISQLPNPPQIVCVTGWNEWTAGAWPAGSLAGNYTFMGSEMTSSSYYFVDEFNAEFNRDIEPMQGGYSDNFYYQLVGHIRQYKGMTPPQGTSAPTTITIDGSFSDWTSVSPVYQDAQGDVLSRNSKGADNTTVYTNNTNRNDIVQSLVTYDANNVYFYVKCAGNISSYTGSNWMLLYIDADKNSGTGWQGYDYVINMGVNSSTQTTVKHWNGSSWVSVGTASYNMNGNQMEISVARSLIAQTGTPSFYFHWNDNPQALNDITQFFINGESAPDRRFNYYYNGAASSESPYPGPNPAAIPGVVTAVNYDNGGEGVAYHDAEAANLGGQYRPNDGVDIETCGEGGYDIGWSNAGEWQKYTVNVSTSGSYTFTARASSATGGGAIHVEFNGINATGTMTIGNTGGWQTWTNLTQTVNLTAGQQIMRVYVEVGGINLEKYTLTAVESPYPGPNPAAIPGTVEAENYDNGGEGLAYHDADAANLGGQYRPNDGVDIETCSEGGYDVGWANTGEWMKYTVNVANTGNYTVGLRVASGTTNNQVHLEFDGTNVTGTITVNSTGGTQTWTTVSQTVSLTSGQHIMRYYVDNSGGGFNINYFAFTLQASIPNNGFELPTTSTYQYGPFTNSWTFTTLSGVQHNGSAWGAPTAPEGVQTAFLQQTGTISQALTFSAGTYAISFSAAQRSGNTQTFAVYYDATLIGTFTPGSSTSWTNYTTSNFTATAGSHTIKFAGTNPLGGDNTAFIDNVSLGAVSLKSPRVLTETPILNSSDISIYPNPVSDLLNITFQSNNAVVELYNLSGTLVSSTVQNASPAIIPVNSLSNGIYFVSVRTNNEVAVKKFIVKK